MTSRQRIHSAFVHQPCDRTPFGELVIDNRCASAILGRETPVHNIPMWLDGLAEGEWKEIVKQEAKDMIDLVLATKLDWISVDQNWTSDGAIPVKKKEYEWEWGNNTVTYNPETMITTWTPRTESNVEEYAKYVLTAPIPQTVVNENSYEVIKQVRERLYEMKLDIPMVMRNYSMSVQNALELIALYPESAMAHFKILSAHAVLNGTGAIKEGVSVISVGGHVGGKNTSLISPEIYRRYVLPNIKEQINTFHSLGAKCIIASGGCVMPFIDDFLIESGTDAYAGIDTDASMDLNMLRDSYGDKICLIGGIDSVHTLTHGTESQIRDEVFRVLDMFKDSSGFMLASSNSVHNGIPSKNFIAMVEAYREYFRV